MSEKRPVNVLLVGSGEPMVLCSVHEGYVSESQVVTTHGGRGREPTVTCIPCKFHSAQAWRETGCPFCVMVADRVLQGIATYLATGEPFTLPEVPTPDLPPHAPDCRWVDDVLDGMPTS